MTIHQTNLKTIFPLRWPKPGLETVVALAGTAFSAILLILTAMYAGPLWRDEINTANLAQMPSLHEFWNNLPFESFPPLWPLLLRGYSFLGMADSDSGIRVLCLYVGVFFLVLLWLCSHWTGGRAPILSIALLGSLPAFIFTLGSNRADGLASCLLVLSFGTIWRMVELPSRSRILLAGLASLLFAQCVYYDVVFLCAMLAGGALVAIRRRQWKTLGALVGIGAVAGASMAIYLSIIHRGSAYVPMNQGTPFNFFILWGKLDNALTARSGALPPIFDSPEVWLWVVLLMGGLVLALVMQWRREPSAQNQEPAAALTGHNRADLALFCLISMLFGTVGYMAFLMKLHYITQTWYYVEMLCLCTISLDGLLGANWPGLRPWGLLRIGFMVLMLTWSARSAWGEAHTRRSNVDLIAFALSHQASAGDLIVVQSAWEGITFDRYYRGRARWVTIPPIDSHKVHRSDLVMEMMNQQDPMAPVLREITDTLRGSNSVWTVGRMLDVRPEYLLSPSSLTIKQWVPYISYWTAQVTSQLHDHALQEQILGISVDEPVSRLENLPVLRFSGYKSNAATNSPPAGI